MALFASKLNVRWVAWSWLLIGLFWSMNTATLAQTPTSGQDAAQSVPADETATKDAPQVTVAEIEARIAQLEGNAELEAEQKNKAIELLRQAIAEVAAAEKSAARIRDFAAKRQNITQNVEDLRRERDAFQTGYSVPKGLELADLERLLGEAQAELETARQELSDRDGETKQRIDRQAAIPKLVDQRTADLEKARQQLAAAAPPGELPEIVAANKMLAQARVRSLSREIETLREELRWLEVSRELVPLRRDQAALHVKHLEIKTQKLVEAVNKERKAEAARQAREAQSLAAQQAYPGLKELAEENQRLAEERAGETGLAAKIGHVTKQLEDRQRQLDDIQGRFDAVREQIKTIGLTSAVAALLRQERAELPDPRSLRRRLVERKNVISDARLRWLRLDDQRAELADLNSVVATQLLAFGFIVPPTEDSELENELRSLLESQRDLLDQLIADYDTYLRKLVALSNREEELVDHVVEISSYIDERILWAESTAPISLATFQESQIAAQWLTASETWQPAFQSLKERPIRRFALGAILVAMVPLVLVKRRLRAIVKSHGEVAAKRTTSTFVPTFAATMGTLGLAAPWPALTLGLALLCGSLPMPGPALAAGLRTIAFVWFPLELLRQMSCPLGLGEAHFDWPTSGLEQLRRHFRWWIPLLLSGLALSELLARQEIEAWSDSLGRLIFMLTMVLVSLLLYRVLRFNGGVLQSTIARNPQSWLARLRFAWLPIAVCGPASLAVMAGMGFYYTAVRLAWRGCGTAWLLLGLLLCYSLMHRWLLVTRRRIAIAQARERRAQLQAAAAADQECSVPSHPMPTPEAELPEVDLTRISEQMDRLLRGLVATVGLIGLWIVWVDTLPALGILRRVELWNTTIETIEQIEGEDGTIVPRVISDYIPITLADVGLAIVILIVTSVASRNIPGFIEIFALQRLPLDRGTRYAISTMARYVIVVIGIVAAATTIGIGWSKVQWLAAAAALGLGFGLQEIFANLVSGLMIFMERPIRVGDVVTVDQTSGTVTRVRIRATTITDWDRKELIIPNREFITGRVINWTHSDQVNRIVITVGVAYGSDIRRATAIVRQVALDNPVVLDDPAPSVYFEQFADSTLNLVLRAYLPNLDNRLPTIHELHLGINQALNASGIEIAFPQRDLHIRTVDRAIPFTAEHVSHGQDGKDGQNGKTLAAS